jgi:8-oxo-dGTP pyrophosphatase MutT (NUDIX family)
LGASEQEAAVLSNYIKELRQLVGTIPLLLPGACLIILDEVRSILLQQRADTGEWCIPGGFMDPGESLEQAVRREAQEETGLWIGEIQFLGVFSGPEYFYVYPNGDQVYNVIAVYFTQDTRGTPQADGIEGSALQYFAPTLLPATLLPCDRLIIEDYLQHVSYI